MPVPAGQATIAKVEFSFVSDESVITKKDGSVERLSFAAMKQDVVMSLIPILAVLRTASEI